MAKIIQKTELAPQVYEFVVAAPLVAHKCQPGQFVMIRTDEQSERIPLTIADFDRLQGTITMIVQAVGREMTYLILPAPSAGLPISRISALLSVSEEVSAWHRSIRLQERLKRPGIK